MGGIAARRSTRDQFIVASEAAAERFYLPELDVLRFLAFLGVFAFHVPPDNLGLFARHPILGSFGIAGSFGVDLFFALSAYLITRLLLRERAVSGRVDVAAFYVRRILRIWPLYFSFLALAFVIFRLAMTRGDTVLAWATSPLEARQFAGLVLLFGNFAFAAWGAPNLLISPLWSICMEEQFYLLWPALMRTGARQRLIAAALAMLAISTTARWLFFSHGMAGEPIWFITFTRLDPIAAGILLAVMIEDGIRGLQPSSRAALLLAGVALWLFAARCDLHSSSTTLAKTMLGYPAIALGSAAFLVATTGWSREGESAFKRMLIYLGKISYGLYVFQGLAIITCRVLMVHLWLSWTAHSGRPFPTHLGQWAYVACALAMTIALAACSYRWLEAPMLRLKQRYAHVASRPV